MTQFTHLHNPSADSLGNNVEEFLHILAGPTFITLDGLDSSRTRAVVTLLHGNEPSGTMALFRWLKSGRAPATNVICVIASVKAALEPPLFRYRTIPGQRDLNRCFRSPFDCGQGKLAQQILQLLKEYDPEAVIDIHNTSGSGPSFGVVTYADHIHDALMSLFTQRAIVTHLRLGALMDISEHLFPTVTIEVGGRLDEEAHELAWEGLCRYVTEEDVLNPHQTDWGLELLHNPVRLELSEHCKLTYAENPQPGFDLTLKLDIEHHNFGTVTPDTLLGWVNDPAAELFNAINSQGRCTLDQLIRIEDGKLYPAQCLKLFMITNDPAIAKMDCLFYAVKDNGAEVLD